MKAGPGHWRPRKSPEARSSHRDKGSHSLGAVRGADPAPGGHHWNGWPVVSRPWCWSGAEEEEGEGLMSGPRLATIFSALCDLGRSLSPLLTTMAPRGQAGLSIDPTDNVPASPGTQRVTQARSEPS